ncbi:MAG: hypothetical protein ACXWFI_14190 [Methylobacter sp.]
MGKMITNALCFFILTLSLATPAFANDKWELEFAFDGPGNPPSVDTMRNYIMGCVPRGSFVPQPPPPKQPTGPFSLTTPGTLTDNQVYKYLNGCNLKPASVTGISVSGED